MVVCLFSYLRDEAVNEIFNSGKEFDERYHWHALKPLTDDFERTKQQFKGKKWNLSLL